MSTVTTLPNLANSFAQLKIGVYLQQNATGNSIIELAIQKAFHEKKPIVTIIEWLQSQIKDNPVLMGQIIGEELALKILRFNLNN